MGEHHTEDEFILSAKSFDNATFSFRALAMLDGFIESRKDSVYYPRAVRIISKMRKGAQEQLEAESEYETLKQLYELDSYNITVQQLSDSSLLVNDKEGYLVRLLVELQPVLDELEKSPIHERVKPIKKTKKFPLKYNQNTFKYGNKSVPLKVTLSFASFCDFFYKNCPSSGKLKISEALNKFNITNDELRQWVSDFNRWARREANFRTQIGEKGKLLRVIDGHIKRLK